MKERICLLPLLLVLPFAACTTDPDDQIVPDQAQDVAAEVDAGVSDAGTDVGLDAQTGEVDGADGAEVDLPPPLPDRDEDGIPYEDDQFPDDRPAIQRNDRLTLKPPLVALRLADASLLS